MKIDALHTGALLFDYLIDVAGAARDAQLQFDSRKSFLKTAFEFLAQLGAGRNRHDDAPFLLGGLDDLVPFRVFRLRETGWRKQKRSDQEIRQCRDSSLNHETPLA